MRLLQTILSILFISIGGVFLLLFDYTVSQKLPPWVTQAGVDIRAVCANASTQWIVVSCLITYFITMLSIEWTSIKSAKPKINSSPRFPELFLVFRGCQVWLALFVGIVLLRYIFDFRTAAKSLQVVVLLAGIVIGKGIALWAGRLPKCDAGEQVAKSESLLPRLSSTLSMLFRVNGKRAFDFQFANVNRVQVVISVLVFLLACASLWHPDSGVDFSYRGQQRWVGPWDNPNRFGALMGVGLTLAFGLIISGVYSPCLCFDAKKQTWGMGANPIVNCEQTPISRRHYIKLHTMWLVALLLLSLASGLFCWGLIKSYSRGAWFSVACGIGFLVWEWMNREMRQSRRGAQSNVPILRSGTSPRAAGSLRLENVLGQLRDLKLNLVAIVILLLSIFVICFWLFRHTESPVMRRLFSVGNVDDFSWRNRVTTWEGAGRMLLVKPVVGFGWGMAEVVYGAEFRAERLQDATAIQLNDYLILGTSAGIPTLICLLVYVWLSLKHGVKGSRHCPEGPLALNLQLAVVAKAGAVVLLIGFWFNSGLFKLPTCIVFWVLIELARQSSVQIRAAHISSQPQPVWDSIEVEKLPLKMSSKAKLNQKLLFAAGILALCAISLTALHFILPQLTVNERNLAIARRLLIPPSEKADFNYLASKSIWSNQSLKILLEHTHLGNYNRLLANWKLDDDLYREYVLLPEITRRSPIVMTDASDLNWRRPLWEFFYPRIRKERDLETAAGIVLCQLREQVKTSQPESNFTILESWQRGLTSEVGFQKLVIAVLRSIGIPARLSYAGIAEFWNGMEWKAASN